MTQAHTAQIDLVATPYYHCVSRCVRRAFLCGDAYEHRREWVKEKLFELADIFCIEIAGYAVMSNHYHLVLFIDAERCESLSDREVVDRWHTLFKGNMLSQKMARGESISKAEANVLDEIVEEWRQRLMSISWFMRVLSESIARMANAEDQCSGRFWEGRFKSQALLDEKALVACLAYVDLNPIRAKMAKTPETSLYTSVHNRIEKASNTSQPNHRYQQPKKRMAFIGNPRQDMPTGLSFTLTDYLVLMDETGRVKREDKRGFINDQAMPILNRLGISQDNWMQLTDSFEQDFQRWVGDEKSLSQVAERYDLAFIRKQKNCLAMLG